MEILLVNFMAKTRLINTKFWSDNFISGLEPLERYLFLYFLTNEHTNICGIYEIPLKTISFETGIELNLLNNILERFEGKIYYYNGWVLIRNFSKHQASDNKNVQIGIEKAKALIPQHIITKLNTLSIPYLYPIDRGGKGMGVFEPKLEPELELEREPKKENLSFYKSLKKSKGLIKQRLRIEYINSGSVADEDEIEEIYTELLEGCFSMSKIELEKLSLAYGLR